MSGARVSLIIPAYNAAAFIREALDSALAQTRPPDEIVVVDDGSTDETPAIVAGYAARGVRFVQQPRQGPSAARNRGLAETSGELVAFLDADDIWEPEKLALQIAALEARPECGMVSCDSLYWYVAREQRRHVRRALPPGVAPEREIAVRNFLGNTSHVLARRSVIAQAGGFDEGLRWCEDWDLWARMIVIAPLAVVSQPLVIYRWHSGGNAHQRRWERSKVVWQVATRANARVRPAWARLPLLARAWSMVALQRAEHAIAHQMPRHIQIAYALQALLCSPLEDPRPKIGSVVRALLGPGAYTALRRAGARRDPQQIS